jgi:WD40 repeat protein/DNA-binding SARP family transcriptional activator
VLLRVLGPLMVDGPDGPVSVGGPVPRRILCALLVRPGAVVSVDGLLDAAWGDDPPPSAERTLISHIARLREALASADGSEPVLVERRDAGYRLVVAPEDVDAVRLEQILLGVKDVPVVDAVPALREAVALWRAPAPFADLQDTAYPAAEAARLTELHSSALEALVAALLDMGDPVSAAAEAEARLVDMPFRERLWELLILALYRQGRQGEALEAYRRARAKLSDELGVDPGPRLRELEARVLTQDPGLFAVPAGVLRPCPYRGLARYETADAELFVGRERLVYELVGRLIDARFLVMVGPSGAGKSSLVRAGLLPALAGGALPGSGAWSVDVIQPGTEPLEVLAGALTDRPDVLVVDQAEEALLAAEGSCLVPFGDRILASADAGTRIVLVLRADFYGLLAGHPALARRAGPATVLVGPPDERELRRIITEPAARVGLRVEPALADLIVAEVRDRPGVLPVLSTALVRTWEHRDGDLFSVASYRAGGGVAAALQRVGEEASAALSNNAQRSACRRLLLRLAADEDGSWVRRWARRADLVRPDDPAAAAALGVLTDRRLVIARADDLGIAHEALLTGWPRLHGWLEDGRSRAAVRERLASAATAWEEADHDPTELYRGTRLQAALDTAATSPEDLTPLERKFLTESADEADRQLAEQRARADREARGRRRARLVAAGLAVALAFAAAAGGYAVTKQRQADAGQRQAQRAARAADAGRLGALARAGGDYDTSLLLAAQAVTLDRSPTTESDLFATLLRGDAVLAVLRSPGAVLGVTFTPDDRSVLAMSAPGQIVRWSAQGGPVEASFGDGQYWGPVTVASDGRLIVLNGTMGTLEALDPRDGRVLARGSDIGANDILGPGSLVGGGRVFVAAAASNPPTPGPPTDVLLLRLGRSHASPQRVRIGASVVRVGACGTQTACVLTESGRLVRIRLSDGTVESSVDLPSGTRLDPAVDRLAASPDGRRVAFVDTDGIVRLVDPRTGHVVRELGGASRGARVLAFSRDGSRVAAGEASTVLVWRTDGSGLPERYDVQGGRVTSAAWSKDGSTLAAGSEDGTVVLWDTNGRRRVGAVLTDALGGDTSTLWATQRAIVAGQVGGRLLFIDPSTGTIHLAARHAGGTDPIITAHAGRAGNLLVTADAAGVTGVWDLATGHLLGTVGLPHPTSQFAGGVWVSPDGRQAATFRTGAGLIVFDPVSRTAPRVLPLRNDLPSEVKGWTADGRSILIIRQQPFDEIGLLVVDATTGEIKLWVPTGVAQAEEAVADPTGRFIALAMNDGTLRILDAKDGHLLAPPLRANGGETFNVSISPDGRYLATSGRPPRVTVWDTRTFRQVAVPLPDVNGLDAHARFGPDGRLVVTSGPVLRSFTIDPAYWLARACREAGRTLTRAEFEQVLPGRPYRPACA